MQSSRFRAGFNGSSNPRSVAFLIPASLGAVFAILAACSDEPMAQPTSSGVVVPPATQTVPVSTSTVVVPLPPPPPPPPPPATCSDGIKNNQEADIDCGPGCMPCADNKLCAAADDCENKVCTGNRCQAATAFDGVKNGNEVDVDCGADTSRRCADKKACVSDADCLSKDCRNSVCQVSAGDGLRNGDETDIDCGGKKAPACGDLRRCLTGDDCQSKVCIGRICQVATNTDETRNLDEIDVDCGGPTAMTPRCANGRNCATAKDCASNSCNSATKKCQAPPPNNNEKDGQETDIDCGGPVAPACAPTKDCLVGGDCQSLICEPATKTCTAPLPTDGVKNADESDVDCGGANAPKCAVGKTCSMHSDCRTDGCNYDKKCAKGRSCTPRFGGDTCGTGEVGNQDAAHESCCETVPLNATTRIDKYEVTAGRIRAFIERTGGNVRDYIAGNPNDKVSPAHLQYLPNGFEGQYGVYAQLGNNVFFNDRPCPGCGQGCWVGSVAQGGYGHNSYWWDDTTQQTRFGAIPRAFTKEQLDTKSMNCITQLLLAAFCAWDGGYLPNWDEVMQAWGAASQPWGDAPNYQDHAAKMTNWNPWGTTLVGNPAFRYAFPAPVDAGQTDQSFAIAAPGRFPKDKGASGIMDLAANIIELTSETTNAAGQPVNDDAAHLSLPRATWVGGSWEGHGVGKAPWGRPAFNILTRYGKAGGRCARKI
jgi:hypothetical protein